MLFDRPQDPIADMRRREAARPKAGPAHMVSAPTPAAVRHPRANSGVLDVLPAGVRDLLSTLDQRAEQLRQRPASRAAFVGEPHATSITRPETLPSEAFTPNPFFGVLILPILLATVVFGLPLFVAPERPTHEQQLAARGSYFEQVGAFWKSAAVRLDAWAGKQLDSEKTRSR